MLRKYMVLGLLAGAVTGCATLRESRRQSQSEQDQINAAYNAKDAISLEEWTTAATFLRNRELATAKFVDLRISLLATADCTAFEAAFQPHPITTTNIKNKK